MKDIKTYILCLVPGLFLVLQVQAATIVVFGDSLSAAYGMEEEAGWVALLQERLDAGRVDHRVINASLSGETTAGGLARLPAILAEHRPDVLLLELGANDGLRGLPLAAMQKNLQQMIGLADAEGCRVMLIGMRIPSNYGPLYTRKFANVYTVLAKQHRLPLVPFLLEKVALKDEYMQPDGLHPNEAAQPLLLDTVWPPLKSVLKK